MRNLIKNSVLVDLLEGFPSLIAIHGIDHRIYWVNKAYCDAMGLSPEEIKGRKCCEIAERSSPPPNCPIMRVFESGQPCGGEVIYFKNKPPLKTHASWYLKASPVKDSDGNVIGAISITEDVTSHKKTEHQLYKEKDFISDIVETSQDWIWAIDLQSVHTYSNAAAEKILGYSQDEFIGKPFSESMHPEDLAKIQIELPRLIKEKKGWQNLTIRWKHKDDSWRTLESSAVPILDSQGDITGFRGVDRDVTERNKLTAQLLQAHKMESVGRLAGGVAHDFNNMLGVILGYSEMAFKQMDSSHPAQASLKEIQKAAQRSADLTRQLLAFARKQVVEPKVLQLNDAMDRALNFLKRLIGEHINLVWLPGKKLWPVKMDPNQVDQILANLCINARDAIEGVGKITIETGNYIVDKAYCLDKPGMVPGEYAVLSVTDTGHGIEKKIVNKIFEPFFTTKPQGKGTGLGLSTVYGIVKQNNGFIYASSDLGEYTTFRVYLPRYSGEMELSKENNKIVNNQTGTETILLVEDQKEILNLMKLFLENLGYTVTAEGSSHRALQIFGNNPKKFHLLITDMIMPEMSGRDLWNEIQAICPDHKCLFMSAYSPGGLLGLIKLEENEHFLQKPFSQKALAIKVREALE
jgi:PAS domain S-box-containing protein